ncbi:MAG: GntR family transcriptional regulator [Proteobacteria bacterium]|nr:GntR family transcriptional regulator [Pseudomonadota bacterium]
MDGIRAARARESGNGRKNAATGRASASAETVFARVVLAIQAHRLRPGTRLVEERLGRHFGVSRTIVRQGLAKLAQAGLVDLLPNRGAQVVRPSVARTREVFAARLLIERAMVADVARVAGAPQIAALRAHLRREEAARRRSDRLALVQLTGEFHLLLADMAGNSVLAETLRRFETITCLAILAYDRTGDSACPPDEHAAIVDAIERRDARKAAQLMGAHLAHVREGLALDEDLPATDDIASALGMGVATFHETKVATARRRVPHRKEGYPE